MLRETSEGDLSRLLARCRKGDGRAWSELVDRFQGYVYSIPRRMGLAEDDCADIFQATFIALHRSLDKIGSAASLPKWIGVTASREALRIRRLRNRDPQRETEGSDDRGLDEILADEEKSAEALAIEACDARTLRLAMSQLGDRCAKLLTALYLEDESAYQEISLRLGIPVGAIGPTRARCLEKLRRSLEEEGFFV